MTTPDGTPSVMPSARDLGEQMQQPGEAQRQAAASRSMEPGRNPTVVGDYMDDVDGKYTEGATVSNDQTSMGIVGRDDTDASET